jgi:hypothetical protein
MRILKTLLASSAFIPLSVIGQLFGWFFAIFCLFIWNITLRGQVDTNLLSRLFSEFFPWVMAGCFGGGFAAFGVRAAYKKYHPTVILFIPTLTAITAILGSAFFILNAGYSHRELGWIITISCNAIVFYVALRDEYPPILNDLEAINKVVQSETLRNLEGDRALVPALQRVDGVLAHREVLLNALDDAQESILILSGFVSGFAVNDDFIKKIESAISRGVKVQIGFGWKHPSGSQPTNLTVKKELRGLLEVQEQTSKSSNLGKLEIYYFPNHSKILIQDDQISIEGSFNWLSTGDSSQNLETSIKLTDKQQVQKALDFYQNKLKSENILTIENLERFSGNYQSV